MTAIAVWNLVGVAVVSADTRVNTSSGGSDGASKLFAAHGVIITGPGLQDVILSVQSRVTETGLESVEALVSLVAEATEAACQAHSCRSDADRAELLGGTGVIACFSEDGRVRTVTVRARDLQVEVLDKGFHRFAPADISPEDEAPLAREIRADCESVTPATVEHATGVCRRAVARFALYSSRVSQETDLAALSHDGTFRIYDREQMASFIESLSPQP